MNAQELLEAAAERIDQFGWKKGAQGLNHRPDSPACVLDSLGFVLYGTGGLDSGQEFAHAMGTCNLLLEQVLREHHGWHHGVVHWNDTVCDGGAQAADLCRLAAKEAANERGQA